MAGGEIIIRGPEYPDTQLPSELSTYAERHELHEIAARSTNGYTLSDAIKVIRIVWRLLRG